jgi:hypothetical protein
MTLTFEATRHRYLTDEGIQIPSVSQVLTLAGISDVSMIPAHILERAAAIGSAVHDACQYLDEGELDPDLDPLIVGYVLGYQRFKEAHEPKILEIETRVGKDGDLPFAGRRDRVIVLGDVEYVMDIKTASKPQYSWPIQLAAYSKRDQGRIVVHLAKDGTFNVIKYENEADYEVWQAALTVAHFKLKNGAKL